MKISEQPYYSIDFFEEEGKTIVVFYDESGKPVAQREIPHQDITEAIRLNGENN